jgi:GTP-binding protein
VTVDNGGRVPVVAVVGRPNVGKSSLVNRILGRREAIVGEDPGVTRDRHSAEAEWEGRTFEVVDTGGLELRARGLAAGVAAQAEIALASADVVVLVVDAAVGVTQEDADVAALLRRGRRPVVVAVNKVDDSSAEAGVHEFHRLGLGEPVGVSALHGRGAGDFIARVVTLLPSSAAAPSGPWAAMALVGRPNVGKSSLLNALVGESRALVAPEPGTTRDPVDAFLALDHGRVVQLVDTAGLRPEVRIKDPLEYFSRLRGLRTLERVDVAALVIDATEGITGHDQRLAHEIIARGRACVVCLNKWDTLAGDEASRVGLERDVAQRLRFMPWARRLRTSAVTRRGISSLAPALGEAVEAHRRRLATSTLNEIVARAQEDRPHGRGDGRRPRVLYAVQSGVGPPEVVLFSTGPLATPYLRYLERRIRAVEPYAGTPIRLRVRTRGVVKA